MILVTGSTGTGKSTTLAAMIDHLNSHAERVNIISLEDPIEFIHKQQAERRSSSANSSTHLPILRRWHPRLAA